MRTIGFANSFYTLWDITSEPIFSTIITANGESSYPSGTKYNCTYIKNVSTDLNKVIKLHPNLEIDETLRGKSNSFDWADGYQKTEYANDVFSNGFNKGMSIASCDNLRELKWAYANENDSERMSNIEKALNNIGAYVFNNVVYDSKELMDSESQRISDGLSEIKRIAKTYKSMSNGGTITVEFSRNLNEYGIVIIDGIVYVFNDFVKSYYNGYNFGMPSINGKGKRVKGKMVELTVITGKTPYASEDCLIVESFKILK